MLIFEDAVKTYGVKMILQVVFLVRQPGDDICIWADHNSYVSCNTSSGCLGFAGSQSQKIMQKAVGVTLYFVPIQFVSSIFNVSYCDTENINIVLKMPIDWSVKENKHVKMLCKAA